MRKKKEKSMKNIKNIKNIDKMKTRLEFKGEERLNKEPTIRQQESPTKTKQKKKDEHDGAHTAI